MAVPFEESESLESSESVEAGRDVRYLTGVAVEETHTLGGVR